MKSFPSLKSGFVSKIRLNFLGSMAWFSKIIKGDGEERQRLFIYFKWHLKEILLCIALAFMLTRVDKLHHFFSAFALDIKSPESDVWWMFTLIFVGNGVAVLWLCFVFWHKPKDIRLPFVCGQTKNQTFEDFYNKGIWQIAMVSSLPVLLVDATLSLALLRNESFDLKTSQPYAYAKLFTDSPLWVVGSATILFIIFCTLLRPRTRKNASLKHLRSSLLQNLLFLALVIAIFTILFRFYHWYYQNDALRYCVLGVFILLPPVAVTFVLRAFSVCLIKEEKNESPASAQKPAIRLRFATAYRILQSMSYGLGLLIFILVNNSSFSTHEWFSNWMFPIAMVLFIFIAYYQAWDLLLHNLTPLRFYTLIVLLLGSVVFFGRHAHYALKFNGEKPVGARLRRALVEEYFLAWAKERCFDADSARQDQNVYLVATEGGGSRSAAWTAALLTRIDSMSNGRFRHHCFAISGVSGGTLGAASVLSWWDNAQVSDLPDEQIYKGDEGKRAAFINRIFKRNYISTALAGFFFYDIFQQIPGVNLLFPGEKSRTDRQQDEENDAVDLALQEVLGTSEKLRPDYLKKTNFLSLYYSNTLPTQDPVPDTRLPLLFSNTCRVEDGRRGILSPVAVEKQEDLTTWPFVAAVDIIGHTWNETGDKAISLGEAANLSELFPYINSTVFVGPQTGSFMDGGFYENLGLTTLSEIRTAIGNICARPDSARFTRVLPDSSAASKQKFRRYLKDIKFKILVIYNLDNHGLEDGYYQNGSLRFFDPVIALVNTPFSGHTDYMYHKIKSNLGAEIIDLPLITNDEFQKQEYQGIIMSRWLSKYEVNSILHRAEARVDSNWVRINSH